MQIYRCPFLINVIAVFILQIATIQVVHSAGSSAILNNCWTEAELQAHPGEEKVRKQTSPGLPPQIATTQYSPLAPRLRNSIRYVIPANQRKVIALTFDLCERNLEKTGYVGQIIDYLRGNHIKATFYAGGKWMQSHPERTKQLMADPLFEMGNHAWTHGNMRMLTEVEMRNQILWTQTQYSLLRNELATQSCVQAFPHEMQKIPAQLQTFRFPYGTCNNQSLEMLANYGLAAIQWNIVTADPAPKQTAQAIARIVLTQIKPGSIIIAHANGRGHGTAAALPLFIPQLQQQGYEFVTVSELLATAQQVVATHECYELVPGDNRKYDKLFGG